MLHKLISLFSNNTLILEIFAGKLFWYSNTFILIFQKVSYFILQYGFQFFGNNTSKKLLTYKLCGSTSNSWAIKMNDHYFHQAINMHGNLENIFTCVMWGILKFSFLCKLWVLKSFKNTSCIYIYKHISNIKKMCLKSDWGRFEAKLKASTSKKSCFPPKTSPRSQICTLYILYL